MTLTQDLANYRQQFLDNADKDTIAVMNRATNNLANSGIIEQTLKKGETAPNFVLPNATGDTVELTELLKQGTVIISFYRGGWCPYCNLELRALQQIIPEIQALGANLVAISPETPDNSLSTAEKNELSFQVLSDVGNKVAREYGLVFTLPQELQPLYDKFNIDIPAHNGDDTFELPIPATYVIDTDGKVILAFANPDYTQRLDPAEIVTALKDQNVTA